VKLEARIVSLFWVGPPPAKVGQGVPIGQVPGLKTTPEHCPGSKRGRRGPLRTVRNGPEKRSPETGTTPFKGALIFFRRLASDRLADQLSHSRPRRARQRRSVRRRFFGGPSLGFQPTITTGRIENAVRRFVPVCPARRPAAPKTRSGGQQGANGPGSRPGVATRKAEANVQSLAVCRRAEPSCGLGRQCPPPSSVCGVARFRPLALPCRSVVDHLPRAVDRRDSLPSRFFGVERHLLGRVKRHRRCRCVPRPS